ncbi:hypothetical protein JA1_000864 [Spathaspora sp. JA1]|nr:hypothetical protein JA1_000864 [Spathaspora sp. JA1]
MILDIGIKSNNISKGETTTPALGFGLCSVSQQAELSYEGALDAIIFNKVNPNDNGSGVVWFNGYELESYGFDMAQDYRQMMNNYKFHQMEKVDKEMETKIHTQANVTRQKLLRRINGISVTLWDVKIKDVLQLERHQKLVVKTLLRDIQDMKKEKFRSSQRRYESKKS